MSEWGDTSENFWSTSPSASSRTITYDKEESLKDEDNCFLILSSDEEKISNQKGRCISRSNRTKEKAKKTPSTDRTNKDLNDSKKRKLTPQQIANIAEYDDYDLDDAVEKLLRPTKRQTLETESGLPARVECPICSRSFPRTNVAQHASACTGAYEDTDEEETSEKNTIASSVKCYQTKHKRSGHTLVGNVNYYAESEDLLASDGTGLNEEITGLSWESKGQTRFS